MNILVSLDSAKANWRVDHDLDDTLIEHILRSASQLVMKYLKRDFDYYDDSNGEIPADSNGDPDVEFAIQSAVLLLGGIMYRDPTGKESSTWNPGYLPAPVTAMLYPLRDPTLA